MAANRGDSFAGALSRVWGRGGVLGCESTDSAIEMLVNFFQSTDY